MGEMEEKLGAILNNPQMMQQIMSMAQAMGSAQQQPSPKPPEPSPGPPGMPIDPNMLKALSGIAQGSKVDQNQQTLLRALGPYLSQNRVNKLEKAMRAAKMAGFASSFLNSGGLQFFSGR